MNARRAFAIIAFVAAAALGASAQAITRIAVVDLTKVIAAYSGDGAAFKEFELEKSKVQTDIDRMSEDIKKQMSLKADADKAGDKATSLKLRDDIDKKVKALTDFVSAKQAALDEQAKKLATSNDFTQNLYKQIQSIAETDGYSLVLNLKSSDSVVNAVLWYSPMIDITDKVIQALSGSPQQ